MPSSPHSRVRELIIGAMLTALAIMIPILFQGTPLQIKVPPFSATLASHVPSMLAMFISPMAALLVGLGSTFGFLITIGPVIAARAFAHVLFGVAGAYLYRWGWSIWAVLLAALPIHAVSEAVAVHLFGFDPFMTWVVIGGGTVGHHLMDSAITWLIIRALMAAGINLGPGGKVPASTLETQ